MDTPTFFSFDLTPKQMELYRKHGLPSEYAQACYRAVPEFLSMDDAKSAIDVYCREWQAAGSIKDQT